MRKYKWNKRKAAQRRIWKNLTPEQKQDRINRIKAGRRAAALNRVATSASTLGSVPSEQKFEMAAVKKVVITIAIE
jgi:hypothetical protein